MFSRKSSSMLALASSFGKGAGVVLDDSVDFEELEDFVKGLSVATDYEQEAREKDAELRESQSYDGEFRFVSLGPQKVRKMAQSDHLSLEDREGLRVAEGYWKKAGGYSESPDDLGWVHRGEPREVTVANRLQDLVGEVSCIDSMGDLRLGGIPQMGEGGSYTDSGVIDWDYLGSFSDVPIPSCDEDWF